MCKYCRFEKCKLFFEGSCSGSLITTSNTELVYVEESLHQSVQATQILCQQLNTLPLCSSLPSSSSHDAFKKSVSAHFDVIGLKVIEFFKALPQFKYLSLRDRTIILPRSLFRICIAVSVFDKSQPLVFGMNSDNLERFIATFPEVAVAIPEQQYLSAFVNDWKPSQTEFALFLQLLFFSETLNGDDIIQLSGDGPKIAEIRQNIQNLLFSYLQQQAKANINFPNERFNIMLNAAKVIADFSTRRRNFYGYFAANNPEMYQSSFMLQNLTQD